MKPTIITLTPRQSSDNTVSVATFEEAFGEFSQAKGRGRARRQKRRMARINNRNERRSTRQEGRLTRKTNRKVGRQQMKTAVVNERQGRKDLRKSRKVARKAMGDEEDQTTDDGSQATDGGSEDQSQDMNYETQPQDQSQDAGYTEQSDDQSQDDGSADDQSQDDGSADDQSQDDGSEYPSDEESGADGAKCKKEKPATDVDGGYDEFYGAEDTFSSELGGAEDYFLNADGQSQKINPKVREITKKIEWNKELVSRLGLKLKKETDEARKRHITAKIEKHTARIKMLEDSLQGYASAKGHSKHEKNRRLEIAKASSLAKKDRAKVAIAGRPARELVRHAQHGGDETPVDAELNPVISKKRIEIPAEQSGGVDGQTGLIGIDDKNDFDAPETRKFDLQFSGADGKQTKKMSTGVKVLIGASIAVAAIYLLSKSNVFSKK